MVVALESRVEVAGVVGAVELGYEVGLVAEQVVPVDAVGEERVLLDLGGAGGTEAPQRLVREQAVDDVLGVVADVHKLVVVVGPHDLVVDDVLEELVGRVAVERRHARQHLVEYDAQRPPVHRLAVPLTQYDLGRQVLRRAAYLLVVELLAVVLRLHERAALEEVGREVHETLF